MSSAINRGLFAINPDGTIPYRSVIDGMRRAKVTAFAEHLVGIAALGGVDTHTCGGAAGSNYHVPPSGIRPFGGPPNATRFEEIMQGIGIGPGDRFDVDGVIRFGKYVYEHPTQRIRDSILRKSMIDLKGFPIELSLGNILANLKTSPTEHYITYEELRAFYVEGQFPDREFQEVNVQSATYEVGYLRSAWLSLYDWPTRLRSISNKDYVGYINNIRFLVSGFFEAIINDRTGIENSMPPI
tara:strand:+ start:4708 stop:5430 length:723 start_codon:yes stop_codon:yes gene_type:complete